MVIWHNRDMTESNEEMLFNEALCARVKRWREEKGWTAQQMAIALGVPAERYRKYEVRSPMPQYLMPRFCLITGTDLENLLLGKPRRRANAPVLVQEKSKVG